jgi:hypothetical protein
MPPTSLSAFAVMMPGPTIERNMMTERQTFGRARVARVIDLALNLLSRVLQILANVPTLTATPSLSLAGNVRAIPPASTESGEKSRGVAIASGLGLYARNEGLLIALFG